MTVDPRQQFQQGELSAALAGMTQEVKRHPGDGALRIFLAELLCFAGDIERADRQLDVAASQDPRRTVAIALFRQVLRAEVVRRQVFEEGRAPGFLVPPPPHVASALRALAALRAGDNAAAAELAVTAERQRPPVAGLCDDQPFDDFRDADDLTSGFLEVLTSTGQYYWIPFSAIDFLTFQPLRRPRDMIWRPARLSVRQGPEGDVFIPVLYPRVPAEPPAAPLQAEVGDALRLGRATHWTTAAAPGTTAAPGTAAAPVRGIGQRVFLVNERDLAITEIGTLRYRPPEAGS